MTFVTQAMSVGRSVGANVLGGSAVLANAAAITLTAELAFRGLEKARGIAAGYVPTPVSNKFNKGKAYVPQETVDVRKSAMKVVRHKGLAFSVARNAFVAVAFAGLATYGMNKLGGSYFRTANSVLNNISWINWGPKALRYAGLKV